MGRASTALDILTLSNSALSAGRNVAAGMTGGLGYFYDEEGDFEDKVNAEIVTVQAVRTAAGEAQLRALLSDHVEKTGAAPLC